MAVDDKLSVKRAALWESFAVLDKDLERLSLYSACKKDKSRKRSDAIGSEAEFLRKSLDQPAAIDHSGSDSESYSRRVIPSYSRRRSSSTSD